MEAELIARYHAGNFASVSHHLDALGERVRDSEHRATATAIAREMMARARNNIEVIVSRLQSNGYRFARPKFALRAPDEDVTAQLDALEATAGVMPIALRAAYEVIGSCNLTGTHPAWAKTADTTLDTPVEEGDFWLTDALVIDPLYVVLEDAQEWRREGGSGAFPLTVAGDALAKAGEGDGLYTIALPSASFDAPLHGHARGHSFVEHLRTAFAFGGFAGFNSIAEAPTAMIEELCRGLRRL